MEFACQKTFPFLALRAAVIDLGIKEQKGILEDIMEKVIENRLNKEMDRWRRYDPDYDQEKDAIQFKARHILKTQFPIGEDLKTDFLKFRCGFHEMSFASKRKGIELEILNKKREYLGFFEGFCDDNYGKVRTGGKFSIQGEKIDLSEEEGERTREPRKVKSKGTREKFDFEIHR